MTVGKRFEEAFDEDPEGYFGPDMDNDVDLELYDG